MLAVANLDEAGLEALEERWDQRLEEDERNHQDENSVPPLLTRYADAFTSAQAKAAGDLLPLEAYARITRELSKGHEVERVLKRHEVPLHSYLHTHRHWTKVSSRDAEIAEQLRKLLR